MHILVTKGGWEKEFREEVVNCGFNCVFDALGGGPITEAIINNIGPKGQYFMIATLEKKAFHLEHPSVLFSGTTITGFKVFNWWQ